mgnify:CR=1 FL=1
MIVTSKKKRNRRNFSFRTKRKLLSKPIIYQIFIIIVLFTFSLSLFLFTIDINIINNMQKHLIEFFTYSKLFLYSLYHTTISLLKALLIIFLIILSMLLMLGSLIRLNKLFRYVFRSGNNYF